MPEESKSTSNNERHEVSPSAEQTPLELFQQKISLLKRQEETGELPTAHLKKVNPKELNEEDMFMFDLFEVWQRVGSVDSVNIIFFHKYRNRAHKSDNFSRADFSAFLANKLVGIPVVEKSLDGFYAEIRDLQESHPDGNLKLVDVDLLGEEDDAMWVQVKAFEEGKMNLPREEFEEYHKAATISGNKSCKHFADFLAARLSARWKQDES